MRLIYTLTIWNVILENEDDHYVERAYIGKPSYKQLNRIIKELTFEDYERLIAGEALNIHGYYHNIEICETEIGEG